MCVFVFVGIRRFVACPCRLLPLPICAAKLKNTRLVPVGGQLLCAREVLDPRVWLDAARLERLDAARLVGS